MLNQARSENLPPDWRAVRFDETKYWDRKFLDEYGVDKMFGVYLVDLSSVTYCCSLTPAYEMNFVGSAVDGGPDDEEQRETFHEEVMTADNGSDLVSYMTCRNIQNHLKDEKNQDKIEVDEDDWKEDPDSGFEVAREYYAGNPTW